MAWHSINNRDKIGNILVHLVSKGVEIKIIIKGEKSEFKTRFIHFEQHQLIAEKLVPDKGNGIIQSQSEVVAEFSVNKNLCRCRMKYVGISSSPPHFGFIVGEPELIEIEEKRREERVLYEMPDFVSLEFTIKREGKGEKRYSLNVLDYSMHGLGALVTDKDFDLLDMLNPGDELPEITFYARSAMIRVKGYVRHKTRISGGRYKGSYLLGIESKELIENCRPIPAWDRNG